MNSSNTESLLKMFNNA